ncbi:uncharacterized protein K489DRAFT_326642 [Dissoconium aciculare CBS 342.82]|uniref:C2H2-type domain-containing protein n=1 Tax=Dissoconium aciculare CBS 342.82 TaxID=1314786 RepID=A0A6J3LTA7_9PEZI|nr:uncharacterized protein K489DRAFT_326642 [Dissoconium aciculare CBS 342.82]KAF1819016.1 hypothetical protein K489DRAFT_326642 [Dissoconium aciculare CBS 342.82]
MTVDSRQQQPQFNSMGYDAMRYPAGPHFTNPWASAAPNPNQVYATSMPPSNEHRYAQASHVSAPYTAGSIAAPALPTGIIPMDSEFFEQSGLLFAQDGMSASAAAAPVRAFPPYSSQPPVSGFAPTSAPAYTAPYNSYHGDRRPSHPSVASLPFLDDASIDQRIRQDSFVDMCDDRFHNTSDAERQNFNDALDASRGMLAMSQSDITPRNIYGNAASVGDYSSASESVDMPTSRRLPKPIGLVSGSLPPAPQSMMGQFSSKVSSSSQKKHKCKICDKRFTRPSSLQTHMYSHTGEKPFACDVEGCGRHFSVVSNLRRHRKVHKGEGQENDSGDEDD